MAKVTVISEMVLLKCFRKEHRRLSSAFGMLWKRVSFVNAILKLYTRFSTISPPSGMTSNTMYFFPSISKISEDTTLSFCVTCTPFHF